MALRLLLDQNLSPETSRFLRAVLGLDVTDTRELGIETATDSEIASVAAQTGRIVVTVDTDFGDIREFHPEQLPGVIRLKIHPQTIEFLDPVLQEFFAKVSEEDVVGALVTAEPGYYRIRNAKPS